jgi:DNA-binding SARP family transcriptional activator
MVSAWSNAQVRLIDGFSVELHTAERGATAIGNLPRNAQRLIAYVGLRGARARSAVSGVLWPDVSEVRAQGSLRTTLWRLERMLPGLVLSDHVKLSLAHDVTVDVQQLEDWARFVFDTRSTPEAMEIPRFALQGELLPGWYDDWVLTERERVRQLQLHGLERLSERLTAAGAFGAAVQAATAAIAAEPLRESAHRALIRAHMAEGNAHEVLRQYAAYRKMLAKELGVAPTALMQELVRPYLQSSRGSTEKGLPPFPGPHLHLGERPGPGTNSP